jgi:hypothetical protein
VNGVANVWRTALGTGRKLWPQEKRTDDGRRVKSSVLPCRRSHAQPGESPFSLQGLREMAEAAKSMRRADGDGELQDEVAFLDG